MPIVGIDNVNVFLPADKLYVYNADDDAPIRDAERIIKARLSGTFSPATLATWVDETTTPEVIQQIAGRLVAALVYAKAFSSEIAGYPEYAQHLYDEAMSLLDQIVLGGIIITDPGGDTNEDVGGHLSRDMFKPNDDSPPRMFTVSDVF